MIEPDPVAQSKGTNCEAGEFEVEHGLAENKKRGKGEGGAICGHSG